MNKPIIGLDFGNYNSFTCFILDFDADTRLGGTVYDLLSAKQVEGIPSVYFYSKRIGKVLVGENAVRTSAVPLQNRLRYLKRHLGEEIELDGKTISYDQAITEVIQHCIRSANKFLHAGWQISTNLVSLSYPATYTCAQRQRLIELVENSTLDDGTKVEVYGTIAEPAAAALDYLAEFAKSNKDTTVLTYDLGGGTFDLGLVSVYPKGRKNGDGKTYYYDVINTRGIPNLGGAEFDDIMLKLLSKSINVPLNDYAKGMLRDLAERTKIDLSTSNEECPALMLGDDYVLMPVRREEFEEASKDLLMKTIDETRRILAEHPNQQPEVILLTGGASQMPMVQKELEKALPQYKGKIVYFRPSKAIAYGAARFGTAEMITDIDSIGANRGVIQQRTVYDIGVRYIDSDSKSRYIHTFIKKDTPFPCVSKEELSYQYEEGSSCTFAVFEAKTKNPTNTEIDRDYIEIMSVCLNHERIVPKGHPLMSRMKVDERGLLTIEAKDNSLPGMPFVRAEVQLENLS